MDDQQVIWETYLGNGPLVATAIHNGHQLRQEVAEIMVLSEHDQLREEDPFTEEWTSIADTRIIGLRSRFEVDLNRTRDNAIYLKPEDSWGLQVWKCEPSPEIVIRSLAQYDAFYSEVRRIFTALVQEFNHLVVFDLHSYCYRREGRDGPPADPETNPEVNIGTGTMDRKRWAPLVDRFIADLRSYDFLSRRLDVRENVKFKGGHFSGWIHRTFPESVCSLAIEVKKFFMDEWTGVPDRQKLEEIRLALQSTIPGVLKVLKQLKGEK